MVYEGLLVVFLGGISSSVISIVAHDKRRGNNEDHEYDEGEGDMILGYEQEGGWRVRG